MGHHPTTLRLEFEYEARKIDGKEFTHSKEKGQESVVPYGELLAKGTTTHMWVNQQWKPARINKVAPEVYDILKNLVEERAN